MNWKLLTAVLLVLILVGCKGKATTMVNIGDSSPKLGSKVNIEQVFSGGSYQCTVTTEQGSMVMKVQDNKYRYEIDTAQGRFAAILIEKDDTYTSYTYIPDKDQWMKITVEKPEIQQQQSTVITKENAHLYQNYDCRKASFSSSEFTVPEEKVMDIQELMENR